MDFGFIHMLARFWASTLEGASLLVIYTGILIVRLDGCVKQKKYPGFQLYLTMQIEMKTKFFFFLRGGGNKFCNRVGDLFSGKCVCIVKNYRYQQRLKNARAYQNCSQGTICQLGNEIRCVAISYSKH